jgi:hypothetical protein
VSNIIRAPPSSLDVINTYSWSRDTITKQPLKKNKCRILRNLLWDEMIRDVHERVSRPTYSNK